jgi:hypothetical protein
MGKRGKTPSLLSSTAGGSKYLNTPGKRTCKRCKDPIVKGAGCAQVGIAGSFGHKTYCLDCFGEILTQSRKDLEQLEVLGVNYM